MNKEKYLKELEKRLKYLKEEEKQIEIFRVSNELDNNEVIKDISAEVAEIYKKYKINPEKKEAQENNKLINFIDKNLKPLEIFIKRLKQNSFKDNLIIIRDIIIIALIVSILKIPFIGVETIMFSTLINVVNGVYLDILNYIIEFLYVIFAVYMFIRLFKRRFKNELKN